MEDFEYSVDISDRDWECFFAECEQCNLLPPSLASLDDSGMSDLDDTASILAKRAQKVDQTAGFSEADRPIDGPPDCEGSPVEHYLSKHGVGGMESVLSGSEEDIHLQCVNIFFERLKNVTEAEKLAEPSQVGAGKNREVAQEEESCSDGQQARSNTLPRNIPKSNSLPARGETAVGKETTKPVDTISNIMKTIKKDEPGSNIFPEPAAYNSVLKTNKSAHPETKLFIVKEACTETKVNEVPQQSQSHDSPDRVETTPHTDKVIKVKMYTSLDDSKLEDYSHLILSKKCSTDAWSNLEMVTNVKWKEDLNVSLSDATSSSKTASQESSPTASIKRKRRKKRRLSAEPAENVYGYERQGLVRPSDSEEEQNAWRGGTSLCVPEDINLFYLNGPQKNFMSATANDLPVKILTKDLSHYSPPSYSQYQNLPESVVRQRSKDTGSTENNSTINRSAAPLSQTDDSVMSASNNSCNLTTNLLPCSKLQVEESPGLNKGPGSGTDGVNGESYLDTETANDGRKDAHAGSLQQSDKMNHSTICCQKEQSSTAEVKSLTHSIFPSAKSSDLPVEISQSVKLSAAKSVLAEEAGHSGRDNHTLCQREAEPQQQLEIDCHYKDQYSSTLEKTHFPLSAANGMSSSDGHNTKPEQLKTRASEFLSEISTQLILDTSTPLPDKCHVSNSPTSLDKHLTLQQIEHPLVFHPSSKLAVLLEKNSLAERAKVAGSQITAFHNGDPLLSVEINGKSQRETKLSVSEDLLTTPSDITPLSSCCTLDTESVMSLSNENITDMSGSYCSSVSQSDSRGQGEKTSLMLAKHEEGERPKSQSVSSETKDSKCDLVLETEDVVTPVSKAECEPEREPDSKRSVFAMSSFWSEMEKLTINDILGLRMMDKAAAPSALPSLQESEETDGFAMMDSGFFTQLDESKPEQIIEDTLSDPKSVESSLGSVSSRSFMWDSEPVPVSLGADIYTENMLTSISGISQPPGSAQTGLRKICKNVSVHNLPALESFSYTWKSQTLQTLNEGGLEKVEYLTDVHMPKQDKDMDSLASSATDSYKISLTNIFQYLFGGKQSTPSLAATDNIPVSTCYTDGNSVPETYDHFFSEFDTESFFYPLITADQSKDELVPVFSFSRSANRNLQFPEAYDHFFASSSSDDSSVESDEEDKCTPVRVVSRFTRTSSSSRLGTDMYDNFFSDSDLKQNFFWKNALSFRNVSFTASTAQKQTLSNSLVPVTQRIGRSPRRTVNPLNALGNQDVMFSDPLLMHLEDRISRQLAQQPFRYEDLQTAVSNPRLDSSLLPLRQSDMCLVCIAFASWVLKTANPQVGDAWKAVLLANVSALSAIRYLRKYVKMEVADSERKLQITAPSDS